MNGICVLDLNREGVKITLVHASHDRSQGGRVAMNAFCYLDETLGTMPHRIKGTHICKQYLGGTDIAGRFIATNVLFAGL